LWGREGKPKKKSKPKRKKKGPPDHTNDREKHTVKRRGGGRFRKKKRTKGGSKEKKKKTPETTPRKKKPGSNKQRKKIKTPHLPNGQKEGGQRTSWKCDVVLGGVKLVGEMGKKKPRKGVPTKTVREKGEPPRALGQ